MKDLPHHIKKMNRRVVRDARREELSETLPDLPTWPESERQLKKKAKIRARLDAEYREHPHKSLEERNQELRHRNPVFDHHHTEPKHAKPTKKKTPKI